MKKGIQNHRPGLLSVILLALVIFFAGTGDATAAGKLTLDTKSFNAGTVKEGVTIERKVTLENIGDREVLIENISTS